MLKLVDTRLGAQGGHRHGEHEGINIFNDAIEGELLHCLHATQHLQQGVETDDADEAKGKPGDGDTLLL